MDKGKSIRYIAILTLFTFLFSFFPQTLVSATVQKNEDKTTEKISIKDDSEVFAILTGDFMSSNDKGANWQPNNIKGLLKKYKNNIYEGSLKLKPGNYNYKIAMNGTWDESYGNNQSNISLNISKETEVIFRLDYKNKKVYDSVNNPEQFKSKAIFTGNIKDLIEGASNWDPSKESEKLDYIGGGIYKKTFTIKEGAQSKDYNLEYKVSYNGAWNNGEVGENLKTTIPAGTKTITILSDYLGNSVTDSIKSPNLSNTISLIGTVREGKSDWDKDNKDFEMHNIDGNKVVYSKILKKGSYEYKGILNHSWDGGGIPAEENAKLNLTEDRNVVFVADLKNNTIIDSINNLKEVRQALNLEVDNTKKDENAKKDEDKKQDSNPAVDKQEDNKTKDNEAKDNEKNMYTYIINYYRYDKNYDNWNLWGWENGKEGKAYDFNKKSEAENGFTKAVYKLPSNKMNFIIKKGNWEDKDIPHDRSIEVKQGQQVEVWLIQGDEKVYYDKKDVDTSPKFVSALMDSPREMLVTSTGEIKDSDLNTFKLVDKTTNKELKVNAEKAGYNKVKVTLKRGLFGTPDIEASDLYEISSSSFKGTNVTMRKILDDKKYYYDKDDLGLTYSEDESIFKVWAPTAKEVKLCIYDNAGKYDENGKVIDNKDGRESLMDKDDNGIWSLKVKENLKGKYYMYKVTLPDGTSNYSIDPYAKSVSANGQRTAIVHLATTNPEGWENDKRPPLLNAADSIIYEMHVRDFSISKNSGIQDKGKFKGITEEGTKLPGTNIKTGIDHLKELGVTTVQLQPSFDYSSVNEISSKPQFNWGYDPQNYNALEGSYSTNAENPEARDKEFKEMVQALHKNGIRAVMDVVYNHTSGIGANSPFDLIVPGYFYRTNDEGKYTNGSGCGNEVATERPMVRKYIKDSVKYFAKEYKVDGFRLDLMGLIDKETVSELTSELQSEVDKSIIIYGEPWQAGGSSLPGDEQTVKGTQRGKNFGVFNDNFRSAIKGDSDGAGKGFVTGAFGKEGSIVAGVKGSVDEFANSPNETINYVTAHDNLNLWDKIIKATWKDKECGFLEMRDGALTGEDAKNYSSVAEAVQNKAKPYAVITEKNPLDNEYVRRSILSTSILMTSQGVPFFQAGDEFLRSKYGDHNSYRSPDAINEINWQNKDKFKGVFDYYQGLIALRKSHPAFRMNTKQAIESNLVFTKADDNVVVFQLKDNANKDAWKNIVVAYNGNNAEKEINLPHTGNWKVVVNEHAAGTKTLETLQRTNKAKVAPLSAIVLYDEDSSKADEVKPSDKKEAKRYIEFTYERQDKDYDGWNIWTWQTGVKDGEKDFTEVKDGKAIAKIEIAKDTNKVGFILRKGQDWKEKDPFSADRYINIDPSMDVTKVTIKSGEGDFFQVPAIKNAEINKGNLDFKYRDKAAYEGNKEDSIGKVQVKVSKKALILKDTQIYDMSYDSKNQFFGYSVKDIKPGKYEYSFLITKDGKTTETEKQEIEYNSLNIDGVVSFSKNDIDYNENTLLNLKLEGTDVKEENIREINIDLTNVGGPKKVSMDLKLLKDNSISETIGIKDNVTSGEKTILVTIIDKNGDYHNVEGTLNVKAKISNGPLDFSFDESRIYFTVTDRFFNGDSSNDDPHHNNYDKKNPYTYHGGDLKGLTDKIQYLKNLGINTIWITPIVENTDFNQMFANGGQQYSYHGYWAKNFETLDPHLGTIEDFKTLIDTAHDNGIKIMVDIVLNHSGYGINKIEANNKANNYPTDKDREAFKGMFRENPGSDFITQESAGLPDFKTEDPAVREKLINWQTGWIERSKTAKGNTIDYFRIDTVKHVDNTTWKDFRNKLTQIDPKFKIIGEYFGAEIKNTADQLQNGQMDALLDFGYKYTARDFVNGHVFDASSYLDERASKIDNTNLMGQFLSSHDEDGFLKTVGDDLGKQMLGATLQITDKGIPVIYYGEELGMSGWNGFEKGDANRYDMDFDRLNNPKYKEVHDHYEKLLNIRKEYSKVFAKGDRKTIAGSNEEGYVAISRCYNGENIIAVLNDVKSEKTVTFKTNFKEGDKLIDLYGNKEYIVGKDGDITVSIPSRDNGGTAILAKSKIIKPEAINNIPTINASDVTLTEGEAFNAMKEVSATDKEDGNLNGKIKVIENSVDTSKPGEYEVTYKVEDSKGASACKIIRVTVNKKNDTSDNGGGLHKFINKVEKKIIGVERVVSNIINKIIHGIRNLLRF